MQNLPATRELILEQLERMLASETFAGAERSRVLLRFLVEHVVENQSDRLKEYTLGSEALGRGDSFDPRTDPIVRAEASRLRNRLERYYATNGAADTILITLRKGSYVPQIQSRPIPEAAPVAATAGHTGSTPGRLQRLIWFVLGGITVGAAVMLFVLMRSPGPPTGEGEVEIIDDVDLGGANHSFGSDWGNDLILSPDGTRIVFVALGSDQVTRLMTMIVNKPRTVVALQGTDGARAPFFSPDGQWVGFWTEPKLKKVSVHGGSPVELTDAPDFRGGSWGEDDYIIAAIGGVLRRVPADPGESTVVADLKNENETNEGIFPWWPQLLPGDTHVLFTAVGPLGPDAATIEVLSLSDGRRTPLPVRGGTFGRYSPHDGHLLFINQGTLFAVPFDQQRLVAGRERIPVLPEQIAYSAIFGFAQFDISRTGRLIYRRATPLVASWLKRGGGSEPALPKPGAYTFPRLSPSGQRLAINVIDSGIPYTDIYDLRRPDQIDRLPSAPGIARMSPVWHPDGTFLVVGSRMGMSWMKADDMSKVEPLTQSSNVQIPWSFNREGTRLAYAEASPDLNLWTIPVGVSAGKLTVGAAESFQQTKSFESYPSFSPDGNWVAYGWGPKGNWNVYVQPFPPDRSQAIPVSQGGGRIARWLPNGRELVYRRDDQCLMVVDYEVKNGKFIAGTPKEWTPDRLGDTGVISNFDVDPMTGDRILGLVPAPGEEAARIRNQATVRLRFSDEVQRRFNRAGK